MILAQVYHRRIPMGRGIEDFSHKYLLAGAGIYDIKLIKLRAGSWFWREVGPARRHRRQDRRRYQLVCTELENV
jgi:hypothetical protein